MNVFLDLDGTLSDPAPGITRSVAYALQKLGLPVPPLDELTWVIGPALVDSFAKMGAPDPQAALAHYRERYTDVGLFENSVYCGINDALQTLRNSGIPMFLATAKPHEYAVRITKHFGLAKFLSDQFGPELDGTRNDKSELLAFALTKISASAADCVMVGDRVYDFAAAKNVGMPSIGVSWGYGSGRELAMADVICHAPKDLPGLIFEMLSGVSKGSGAQRRQKGL
ncbi:MAG: HAD hydrolase-like protein [Paracoccaceae bacterium]